MKKMKKILALVIGMMMIMGITAMADETSTYTISVKSGDTHTYTVFQVLTGTLIEGQNKLGNAAWGADATADAKEGSVEDFVDALNATGITQEEIAALVSGKVDTTGDGRGTVSSSKSLEVAPGYYVLVDSTASLSDGDSYSLNIVQVANDVEVQPKKGTTTSDKKIDDINDSNDSENSVVWEDSADYDIGDKVPFRLSATIADDYPSYTKGYKLTFHDKMEAGLTFNNDVKVYVGEIKEANEIKNIEGTTYFTVDAAPTDKDTFDVHFENLKSITSVAAKSVIYVTFSATLNESAEIGSKGNKNVSHITYSNNPNDSQVGENGKTPDDTVRAFTFKAIFDKYTTEGSVKKHLSGANFALYKVPDTITDAQVKALKAGDTLIIKDYTADVTAGKYDTEEAEVAGSVFTFNGIDDGTYVLVETETPDGYNTVDNLKFVVQATHDKDKADPQLLTLTGNMSTGVVDAAATTPVSNGTNARTAEVLNNQGGTLPSTGGVGTTIFYVIGAILVLGAGVLLVSKKRMSAK